MKNLLKLIVFIAILGVNPIYGQDKCNCIKDLQNNQISVPEVPDGVTIQFFYTNSLAPTDGEFMSQIVYEDWKTLQKDFPASNTTDKKAVIKFDWNRLACFNKYQNWCSIVNEVDGQIYIGNYLDMNKNHKKNNIKIIDIQTSCFHPSCSPEKLVFTIKVFLTKA